jgi:ribonuclease D
LAKRTKGVTKVSHIKKSLAELSLDELDIDNSYYPFIPKIKTKKFQISELDNRIEEARQERKLNVEKFKDFRFGDRKLAVDSSIGHPYHEEIVEFIDTFKEKCEEYNKLFMKLKLENKFTMDKIDMRRVKISELLGIEVDKFIPDYSDRIPSAVVKLQALNQLHNFLFSEDFVLTDEVGFITTHLQIEYLPLSQTRYFYIDDPQSLHKMISEINSHAQEIAVDLEHHNIESYLGITCLMQISTRFTDYIIDTLKLRSHLHELGVIFSNPNLVKVLHGADFDIEWLQKDFGIYVVNMFDTGQAARVLNLTSYSLANLLASVCSINADKKYQQADWRQRPLSPEMIKYAREDTHYLLYIYDYLRDKLIQRSLEKSLQPMYLYMQTVSKSTEITGKLYAKPAVKSQEYYQMKARNVSSLSPVQFSVMKLLFKFRDYAARKLDVSSHHVLNNKLMFQLVKLPNYDLNSVYITIAQHSLFRNFVNEFVNLVSMKLANRKDKAGNSSKNLESNYIEKMRAKLNESKRVVAAIGGHVTTMPVINFSNVEGVKINPIQCKGISRVFPGGQSEMAENYQKEYTEVTQRLENFNLVNFLKDKYEMPIQIKVNTVPKATTKPVKVASSLENKDEERYLKHKRQRDDYIDLTEVKPVKQRKSSNISDESDEIKTTSKKTGGANINKFLDNVKDFQKNIKK